MQYLQSQPFSVGLASKKFSEGWDRTFAKKTDAVDLPEDEKTKSTDSSTEQAKKSESQSRV
jgi:hypothetical protein